MIKKPYWRVFVYDDGKLLPMVYRNEAEYPTESPAGCTLNPDHKGPVEYCHCGYYSCRTLSCLFIAGGGLSMAPALRLKGIEQGFPVWPITVLSRVVPHGRIMEDEAGVARSEYLQVLGYYGDRFSLALPRFDKSDVLDDEAMSPEMLLRWNEVLEDWRRHRGKRVVFGLLSRLRRGA